MKDSGKPTKQKAMNWTKEKPEAGEFILVMVIISTLYSDYYVSEISKDENGDYFTDIGASYSTIKADLYLKIEKP